MFRPIRLTPQTRFGVPQETPANAGVGADAPPSPRLGVSCACRNGSDPPTAPIQPPGTNPYGSPGIIPDVFDLCQYILHRACICGGRKRIEGDTLSQAKAWHPGSPSPLPSPISPSRVAQGDKGEGKACGKGAFLVDSFGRKGL